MGATKVYPGKTVYEPESAVFDPAGSPYSVNYSSGGGFSNVYPIPKYQQSAVATFFEKHNPPYKSYSALAPDTGDIQKLPDIGALAANTGGIYNRIGRGVPDVAANGDNIAVCMGGPPILESRIGIAFGKLADIYLKHRSTAAAISVSREARRPARPSSPPSSTASTRSDWTPGKAPSAS